MLSNLDSVSPEAIINLSKNLHTVICHDQTIVGLGYPKPAEYNIESWFEPDAKKRFASFQEWVTAYFQHEDVHSGDPTKIQFNPTFPCKSTFDTTPEVLENLTNFEAFVGSDTPLVMSDAAGIGAMPRRVLFDRDLSAKLPDLHVRYYYGEQTIGPTVWSMSELKKELDDPARFYGSGKARDVKFITSETGNHFNFWDQPDEVLVEYRRCINA